MVDYSQYSEETLIKLANSGDEDVMDYILDKYKNVVKRRARAMYLIGGENEDLIQEGMIGLFKAIRDFDETKQIPFSAFAEICVSRQIYTAVQVSNRKKHKPLNSYVSLSQSKSERGDYAELVDMLESVTSKNPEDVVIHREAFRDKIHQMKKELSPYERQVLDLFLAGEDYLEIGEKLNRSPKSIDNALQRMKQKIQNKNKK
ncbi:MAG TPA: RNA polymerase sporulation sigma factor SigH [Candidatus Merdenecus merdavium]|nr:RNA polymerase sporulation sigma factor SigH [Candidatus Merdenecus merdavium]